jgi:hypothetical protein
MKDVCRCFLASICLILLGGQAFADLEVSALPNRAQVEEPVLIYVDASGMFPSCSVHVDFGDGTPEWSQECVGVSCQRRTSHVYMAPAVYTITARTLPGPCGGFEDTSTITIQCTPLVVSETGALSSGSVGKAYSEQIQTTGGRSPIRFGLASGSLPPGLDLSSSGLVSGTPTRAGDHSFTIRATDSCPGGAVQSVQKRLTIPVTSPCAPLQISTNSMLPPGGVGQPLPYRKQIEATGQPPIHFVLAPGGGVLPPGLSLSPSGVLSGKPTRPGKYSFAIRATDRCPGGQQMASKSFRLAIEPQKHESKRLPAK